jgi:translation initiation factor IF-3
MNERIRRSPVRLIGEDGDMIGVVPVEEALQRARDAELDLVEISPDADPPVCRILDYGKFRYEQSKKEKAQKAKTKALEMKEVRLGRSMKIDPHDVSIRVDQARHFLVEGHKVQIVQNFRGREMMHRNRGDDRMEDIANQLSDVAKVEMPPRMAGRRMTMILAPDKPKVDAWKRRHQPAGKAPAVAEATSKKKLLADHEPSQREENADIEFAEEVEHAARD